VGLQSSSGVFREDINLISLPGFETGIVQPVSYSLNCQGSPVLSLRTTNLSLRIQFVGRRRRTVYPLQSNRLLFLREIIDVYCEPLQCVFNVKVSDTYVYQLNN
jgi:hypothetical protein